MKRIVSLLLSVIMVFSVVSTVDLATYAIDIIQTGNCGVGDPWNNDFANNNGEKYSSNLQWTLNIETGLLEIYGEGEMGSCYIFEVYQPWKPYRQYIKSVIIYEGVTNIGAAAFAYCSNIETIYIPQTIEKYGMYSFESTNSLKNIYYASDKTSYKGPTSSQYSITYNYPKLFYSSNVNADSLLSATWNELGLTNFHEYLSSYASISKAIKISYESNEDFLSSAAAWKTAHLFTKPGNAVDELYSEKTIYSSILLSMINSKVQSENYASTIKEKIKLEYANYYNEYLKVLNKCENIDFEKIRNGGKYTDSERKQIVDQLAKQENLSDTISNLSTSLKWTSTINETVNLFVNYSNLKSTKESIINTLKTMDSHTNNYFYKSAIKEIIDSTNSSFDAYIGAVIKGAENSLVDVGSELINKAWGNVLKTNPITSGALIGYSIGTSVCNILFKTDKQIANYFEFCALYEIEKSIMATINDYEASYVNLQNSLTALNYITSVSMFFELQYQTIDIAIELGRIKNLCPFSRIFYNGKKTFSEFEATFNETKRTLKDYETTVFRLWLYSLRKVNNELYNEIKNDLADIYSSDLDNALVRTDKLSYDYTGNKITPNITVIHNNVALTENVDYTIQYGENISPGLGKIKIIPTTESFYTGSKEITFVIKEEAFTKRYSIYSNTNSQKASTRATSLNNLPNMTVYNDKNEIVVKIDNGEIIKDDLPVYVGINRIDIFLYNTDYKISMEENNQNSFDGEIQTINDNMEKQGVVAYNEITSSNTIDHYIYGNGTDKLIINESEINYSFNSNDNNKKFNIVLNNAKSLNDCYEAYPNQRIHLSAIEDEGYYLTGWNTSDDVVLSDVTSISPYFIMPESDVEVSALFTRNNYYFSLKEKIAEAKEYSPESYTKNSFDKLKEAILLAQQSNSNKISEYTYLSSVYEIDTAIDNLELCKHIFKTETTDHLCTELGISIFTCSICKFEKQEYISTRDHKYELSQTVPPTCNSKGYNKYTCYYCKDTYQDDVDSLDGSALSASLENAEKYLAKDYFTEESYNVLQQIYDCHKNDLDALTTQEDVDNAVVEINTAINNLVLDNYANGKTDDGFEWHWEKSTGILTVRGTGNMSNYGSKTMPWYDVLPHSTKIIVSDGITTIGKYAFYNATNVTHISLPNSLAEIEQRAFEYCISVEELVVPDTVQKIGYGTFANMTNLKKVTVPASTTYRSYCFDNDKAIEEIKITYGADGIMPIANVTAEQGIFTEILSSMKKTGSFGPWKYAENAAVKIESGVSEIGDQVFYYCSGIENIELPDTVKRIGSNNFVSTDAATEITIHNPECAIQDGSFTTSNTIRGYSNSTAEVFANNNSIPFKSIDEHTHTYGEWTYNGDAEYISSSNYKNGTQTRTCSVCGEEETIEAPNTALLSRRGNALALESSITLTTYITKDVVDYYDEVYAEFTRNGKTEIVYASDKTFKSGSTVYNIFDYAGISPQAMGDDIEIKFYGIKDGVKYWGETYTYSVTTYVTSTLSKSTTSAKLKTMLVDLMYYGEACQIYQNYKTDSLMTNVLTDEQKKFKSSDELNLKNVKDSSYVTCENRLVRLGTALRLNNAVEIAIPLNMTNVTLEELTFKVKLGSRDLTYTYADNPENFEKGKDGYWYYYFDGVYANQMSDEMFITAYKGDEQVSYTLKYSVESYAATVTDEKLKKVTDTMIRYGNSAKVYSGQ